MYGHACCVSACTHLPIEKVMVIDVGHGWKKGNHMWDAQTSLGKTNQHLPNHSTGMFQGTLLITFFD